MSWETFQSVCQDKLDLLIRFSYGKETVGVDSGMLRSIDSFVDKVVKGSKCVGIEEWRGNKEVSY